MNKPQDPRIAIAAQIIKQLRRDDLNKGHCFMIHDRDLPPTQSYYEYPDGRIQIEEVDAENLYNPRKVIKTLNENEVAVVMEKHAVFH